MSFGSTPDASIRRRLRRTARPPSCPSRRSLSKFSRLSFPADRATSQASGDSSVFSTSFFQSAAYEAGGLRDHNLSGSHRSALLCRSNARLHHTGDSCAGNKRLEVFSALRKNARLLSPKELRLHHGTTSCGGNKRHEYFPMLCH